MTKFTPEEIGFVLERITKNIPTHDKQTIWYGIIDEYNELFAPKDGIQWSSLEYIKKKYGKDPTFV